MEIEHIASTQTQKKEEGNSNEHTSQLLNPVNSNCHIFILRKIVQISKNMCL
jgi:hypothetical protein